jgi:protein-S-isoprenylcysteine O-methyltransferase Ste14
MVSFWWVSSNFWQYALVFQLIVILIGTYPYRYIAKNIEKIRGRYKKEYGKFSGQRLWLYYESYTIPLMGASLYLPLILKTDYFLPKIVNLPSNIFTDTMFPIFVALPLGLLLVFLGFLISKPSGGFGSDVDSYLYLLYPEKGKLIMGGVYQYIRNPRYLGRSFIAIGFGVIANNLLAVGVAAIHSLMFCSLILPEDKELSRRFGNEFDIYRKRVPALWPKIGNWINFFRFIIVGEKK